MAVSAPPTTTDPLLDELAEPRDDVSRGAPIWAVLLHDVLTRPTGFQGPTRFAALMLIDGTLVLLTLLAVVLAVRGPVSAAFYDRASLMFFFSLVAVFTLCLTGLYWRSWRFMSFGDGIALSTSVAGGMAAAWSMCFILSTKIRSVPMDAIGFALLHTALLLVVMIGARTMRRGLREIARAHIIPPENAHNILLLGELDWIRSLVEMLRADRTNRFNVVGALTFDGRETKLQVAGVPVLGSPDKLPQVVEMLAVRRMKPESLVIRGDASMPRRAFSHLVKLADQCDLTVARANDLHRSEEGEPRIEIKDFELADLLGRPEVTLERNIVDRLIRSRRVLVTGAGGTIGGELVRQIATFNPAEIVLLDHCEFNLYTIEMQVRDLFPQILCRPELCSIRERSALDDVFSRHQPELVFHAAALKHVPIVEGNPCAGAHTNVLGTRNVADAVCAHGALAMIQVSTDKAVNPVGVMGAT
ncbi:MAG TPA: polysaccharide biosynthesis protein, partial [Sphingobium sp.]|nr:polysaccharide biosynthesis protein [Sphingobium sp.]